MKLLLIFVTLVGCLLLQTCDKRRDLIEGKPFGETVRQTTVNSDWEIYSGTFEGSNIVTVGTISKEMDILVELQSRGTEKWFEIVTSSYTVSKSTEPQCLIRYQINAFYFYNVNELDNWKISLRKEQP